MKPHKPLPRQSKRRAAEAMVYRVRKKLFLEANVECFVCGCWTHPPFRDLHHTRGRAGTLYLDERFWVMACRHCHDRIHKNVKWAIANDFIEGPGCWNVPVPL